jgi:adenylosuccinate synthase
MNTIVVGTQWGDEGKAKIVDFLAESHHAVVRFNGGANAGHTSKAIIDGVPFEFVFHLLPAGALHPGVLCIVGNGVALDPFQLLKEINELEKNNIHVRDRLILSASAHLVLPVHRFRDQVRELERGGMALGTTGRGIGPLYSDKAARIGIRLEEALYADHFRERLFKITGNIQPPDSTNIQSETEKYFESCLAFADEFRENIQDTSFVLNHLMQDGKAILFEGAQATFLDLDHGTYPFVTSSNAVAGGACTGAGVGPMTIDRVLGVAKAYLTRVGRGPFPTELGPTVQDAVQKGSGLLPKELLEKINLGQASASEKGNWLRLQGGEFGATTGRPRRTGWLDLPMLAQAVAVNGLSELALTKLDVLDGLKEIPICIAYELNGQEIKYFPSFYKALESVKPIYKIFPGWEGSVAEAQCLLDLPKNARNYLNFISEFLSIPITLISTGPERNQTIEVERSQI